MRPAEGTLAAARSRNPVGSLGRTGRRWRRLPGIALSAAVLFGGAVAPALVQSPARADTPSSLRAKAATLAGQLHAAYLKLDVLDEAYDRAQMKVAGLRHAIGLENAVIGRSERQMAHDTAHLRQVAIDAYVSGATSSGLTALLAPGRPSAPEQQAYLSAASGNLHQSISTVAADRGLGTGSPGRRQADRPGPGRGGAHNLGARSDAVAGEGQSCRAGDSGRECRQLRRCS